MVVQKAAFAVLQDLWLEIQEAPPTRSRFELWVVVVNVADSLARMFGKMGHADESATFDWLCEIAVIRAAMEQEAHALAAAAPVPALVLPGSVKNEKGAPAPATPTPREGDPRTTGLKHPQHVLSCLKRPGYGG